MIGGVVRSPRLPELLRRARGGVRGALDVVLPLGMAAFLAALVLDSAVPVPGWARAVGVASGVVQGLALSWRRSRPRTVMAVTVLGGLIVQDVAPDGVFPYAAMVALWSLAALQPPRASLPGLAVTLAITAVGWPARPPGDTPFAMVVVVAVWALGEATRSRLAAAEHASRRAVDQEHARLARELHDVIAHSVSVMVVQAAAADDIFDTDPGRARTALRAVEGTGRGALAELRRLLAALGPAEHLADLRPPPDLDGLEALAQPLRALGLSVHVRREGDPGVSVPSGVALSAYRIVQEALTNIVRHARAGRVEVRLRADRAVLEVRVTDDGRGPGGRPGPGCGRGIPGMRERAAVLGGSLDAGPRPGGGFQVLARLPLEVRG